MRIRQTLLVALSGLVIAPLTFSIAGGGQVHRSSMASEGSAQLELVLHRPLARAFADTLGACIYKKYGTQDCLQTTKADCDKLNGQWAQNAKCPGDQ